MHNCVWPWYAGVFGVANLSFCCVADKPSHWLGSSLKFSCLNDMWNHENILTARQLLCDNKTNEICPSTCAHFLSGSMKNLWDLDRRILKNLLAISDPVHRERAKENYFQAKESFFSKETIVKHKPVFLLIGCGDECNLRCKFCYNVKRAVHNIPSETVMRFVDSCADTLTHVHLTGGEPLITKCGKSLLARFGCQNKNKYHFIVDLGTNGHFFDHSILSPVPLGRIQISTDAATKSTYEKIRINGDFDKLLTNIKEFVNMAKSKPSMDVMTNFTVTSDNYHEIPAAVELYEGMGLECWFHLVLWAPNDPMTIADRKDLYDDFLQKIDMALVISKNKFTIEKLQLMKTTILNKSTQNDL